MKNQLSLLLLAVSLLISCTQERPRGTITTAPFGEVAGQEVNLYTITFPNKLMARVTNYGGIVTSLQVPDRSGRIEDIVLGYDQLDGYLKETPYFGALIGRFGNRIANGRFRPGRRYFFTGNQRWAQPLARWRPGL